MNHVLASFPDYFVTSFPYTFIACNMKFCTNFMLQVMNVQGLETMLHILSALEYGLQLYIHTIPIQEYS